MPLPGWQGGQTSLFADDLPTSLAPEDAVIERVWLDAQAWVDLADGWVRGSTRLFETLVQSRHWGQRTRRLYDKQMLEPRLTSHWHAGDGVPLEPPLLEEMRQRLGKRYGREFDSVGFNLYRDGNDSVAWHRDRIHKDVVDPVVALVSLGEPRRFLLRPRGGGASRAFSLGEGALLVTGGQAQRTWEHTVPKVAHAGPRISLAFRHGLDVRVYGELSTASAR